MALTVKSRRDRSVSRSVAKETTGLRDPLSYRSVRKVVTSTRALPRCAATVPNSIPVVQTFPRDQRFMISSERSGGAGVAKSRSGGELPPRASRTQPP